MVPSLQTFDLVPHGTDVILYLVFTPFAIAFSFGIYWEIALIRSDEACHRRSGGIAGARPPSALRPAAEGVEIDRAAGRTRPSSMAFCRSCSATTVVAIDWDVARPLGVRILSGSRYL